MSRQSNHDGKKHCIFLDIPDVLADPGESPDSLYTGIVTAIDGAIEGVQDMQSLMDTNVCIVCTSPDPEPFLDWVRREVMPHCPSVQLIETEQMGQMCAGILITANSKCVVPQSPYRVIMFGESIRSWDNWTDPVVDALARQCDCTYDCDKRLCPDGQCSLERHNVFCEYARCRQCKGECECAFDDELTRCRGERCHHMIVPHISQCNYKQCIDCTGAYCTQCGDDAASSCV